MNLAGAALLVKLARFARINGAEQQFVARLQQILGLADGNCGGTLTLMDSAIGSFRFFPVLIVKSTRAWQDQELIVVSTRDFYSNL
jgi:hypothetical protein